MAATLSTKTRFLLALGVPCIFLLVLELAARAIVFFQGEASASTAPRLVEMPTWMQREANARLRTAIRPVDEATLEWLRIFEEGDGFRVRLVPNRTFHVLNTFSRVTADENIRYEVRSNSLGFRSPEPTIPKPSTLFRVAVFGDSSSFGWGVATEHTFTHLLREELTARLPKPWTAVEVVNFAIPGDSSEYGRLVAERFLKKLPADLVILGFGANDAKQVAVPHRMEVTTFRETKNLQRLRKVLDRSALVRGLRTLLAFSAATPEVPRTSKVPAVSKRNYRQNLRLMAEEAKSHGARRTLVLTLCTPANYRKTAHKLADAHGYLFLDGQSLLLSALPSITESVKDLLPLVNASPAELREQPLFYVSSDGCHPNALGHHLIARELADTILQSGSL